MGIIICAYTYMLATIKWWLAEVMLCRLEGRV
jgi:hypothetical protein